MTLSSTCGDLKSLTTDKTDQTYIELPVNYLHTYCLSVTTLFEEPYRKHSEIMLTGRSALYKNSPVSPFDFLPLLRINSWFLKACTCIVKGTCKDEQVLNLCSLCWEIGNRATQFESRLIKTTRRDFIWRKKERGKPTAGSPVAWGFLVFKQ